MGFRSTFTTQDYPIKWPEWFRHDCGGVTRCQIDRDAIKWSEPEDWRQVNAVTHDGCYGCSDV